MSVCLNCRVLALIRARYTKLGISIWYLYITKECYSRYNLNKYRLDHSRVNSIVFFFNRYNFIIFVDLELLCGHIYWSRIHHISGIVAELWPGRT